MASAVKSPQSTARAVEMDDNLKENDNMERLTNAELEAIRERVESATEGPWFQVFKHGIVIESESDEVVAEDVGVVRYPDANFIAHAREDIPKLLAEIDQLSNRLGEAEDLLSEAHDLLDNVHCYDTEIYKSISKYLYGGDSD